MKQRTCLPKMKKSENLLREKEKDRCGDKREGDEVLLRDPQDRFDGLRLQAPAPL